MEATGRAVCLPPFELVRELKRDAQVHGLPKQIEMSRLVENEAKKMRKRPSNLDTDLRGRWLF